MRKIVIILLMSLSPSALFAQITLEQRRTKAREHYPAIRQYELVEQTRELSLSNASNAWLPQIMVGAQATWQTAVATFPELLSNLMKTQGMDIPGIRKDQYQASVQVDQPLWDGGQGRAQRELAEARALEQAGQLDVDMYALEQRIDDMYFGILMLESRISQSETMISLLKSNWEQAKAMIRGGVALQSDADAIEAEILQAGQSLSSLRSALDTYRQVLEIFIGEPLPEELERPSMPRARETSRPELTLLDAKIGTLTAQEGLIKTSILPRISLFAQGWYGYPGLDMFKSMTSADWSWNAIVGIRMNWNVSALFTRDNQLQQISTAKSQAEVQKDLFSFNTRLQSIGLDADVSRLQNQATEDVRICQLRRRIRQSAESQYRNGTITIAQLLKAITDETTAEAAAENHVLELLKIAYESRHNR